MDPNLLLERTVEPGSAPMPSKSAVLKGQYVTLEGFREEHVTSLWRNLDTANNPSLLRWLPWPSMTTEKDFWSVLKDRINDHGFVLYAIKADPTFVNPRPKNDSSAPAEVVHSEVVGMISYLDIQPEHRALEVGAVLFGSVLRRSAAATEAHYLMLLNACEPGESGALPYRRVVWKCNSLNTASRRAAERLGYVYEGTFRNHYIVNGKSRDSQWFSILDTEWPVVKAALQQWLDRESFDDDGQQIKTLDHIRNGLRLE